MEPIIDFERVDKFGPQQAQATVTIAPEDLDREEVEKVGEIRVEARARRGEFEREYLVEGEVSYTADLRCDRCLEPFPFANSAPFAVRYRPHPAAAEGEELEISGEGELDVEYYSEPHVALRQIASEQIQLSIPMKALCGESCQGLCPQCGANLTRGTCSCNDEVVDERWQGLQQIRDQLTRKKEQ